MKLGYYSSDLQNVGDELNVYIWQKYLPMLHTMGDDNDVFIGIGSILDKRFDDCSQKVVFGSGSRGEYSLPEFDSSWDIRFVRGPMSADLLSKAGVRVKYITDPAILIARWHGIDADISKNTEVGLIPFYKADHDAWKEIADRCYLRFISPRQPVEVFIKDILQCRYVITEAMHGAIFADSLRVPWIAYSSVTRRHELGTHVFKWNDWCRSMDLVFSESEMPEVWHCGESASAFSRLRYIIKRRMVAYKIKRIMSSATRNLSSNSMLARKLAELEFEIETFKKEYSNAIDGASG